MALHRRCYDLHGISLHHQPLHDEMVCEHEEIPGSVGVGGRPDAMAYEQYIFTVIEKKVLIFIICLPQVYLFKPLR